MDRVLTGKTQQNSGGTYSDLTSVTRAYDGFGRMDAETQDGSFALAYAHDESGTVKEITYPSGSVIVGMRYTLDDLGRPTTIERKLSTAVEGISTSAWETAATVKYHGHREVERVQAPYDLKRTQSWTSFKEPADLEYKKNASPYTLLTGLACQWNADGQMVVRERMHDEAGGYEWGEVFRYDRMGRLTKMWYDVRNPGGFSVTNPVQGSNPYDHKVDWALGKVYERDSVTTTTYAGAASPVTYTDNTHYQVTAGPAAMTWNNNGYLTDRGSDDFAWTALGQLRQAAISGGDTLDYTYDAFGRRVKTVVGSQTNRFLYHGWHMIGEYDSTASKWFWQEGPWNSGERMLEHIALDTSDVDDDSNTTEYRQYAVHEDFQDTAWGLSGTNATIAERYNYTDPYGKSDSEDGSGTGLGDFATQVFHLKRMHGGFVELESELYDFRNRWSASSVGSWTRRDYLRWPEAMNYYQVLMMDPLSGMDEFGLATNNPFKCPASSRITQYPEDKDVSSKYYWDTFIRTSGASPAVFGELPGWWFGVQLEPCKFDVGLRVMVGYIEIPGTDASSIIAEYPNTVIIHKACRDGYKTWEVPISVAERAGAPHTPENIQRGEINWKLIDPGRCEVDCGSSGSIIFFLTNRTTSASYFAFKFSCGEPRILNILSNIVDAQFAGSGTHSRSHQ